MPRGVVDLEGLKSPEAHLRAAGVKTDFDGRRRAGCQVAVTRHAK